MFPDHSLTKMETAFLLIYNGKSSQPPGAKPQSCLGPAPLITGEWSFLAEMFWKIIFKIDFRICLDHHGTLTLAYAHPKVTHKAWWIFTIYINTNLLTYQDRGQVTCVATDGNGNYSRSLDLEVKVSVDLSAVCEFVPCNLFQVLNIILFPVSIAASFVTLSWNTSQSLARDYILQVGLNPRRVI